MKIKVCGKWEEWTPERVAAERESDRKAAERDPERDSLYRFDDGWLSQWARVATYSKWSMIEEILAEPIGKRTVPYHCGRPLRQPKGPWGTFFACDCGFKKGWNTVYHGRAHAEVEWREETYPKGIAMSNVGNFYIADANFIGAGPTAGQLLGVRD